jgi:hypothetical protein
MVSEIEQLFIDFDQLIMKVRTSINSIKGIIDPSINGKVNAPLFALNHIKTRLSN